MAGIDDLLAIARRRLDAALTAERERHAREMFCLTARERALERLTRADVRLAVEALADLGLLEEPWQPSTQTLRQLGVIHAVIRQEQTR